MWVVAIIVAAVLIWQRKRYWPYVVALWNPDRRLALLQNRGYQAIEQQRYDKAERVFLRVLAMARTRHVDHNILSACLCDLGMLHARMGHFCSALPYCEEAWQLLMNDMDSDPVRRLHARHSLAYIYRLFYRYADARKLLEDITPAPPENLDVQQWRLLLKLELARVYRDTGQCARAEEILCPLLEQPETKKFLLDTQQYAAFLLETGILQLLKRNDAEADAILRRVRGAMCWAHSGMDYPGQMVVQQNLALLAYCQQRYVEAETLLVTAHADVARTIGEENAQAALQLTLLAQVYIKQQRLAEAEELLVIAQRGMVVSYGDDEAIPLTRVLIVKGELAAAREDLRQAEAELLRARALLDRCGEAEHITYITLFATLGDVYTAQGHAEQAHACYVESHRRACDTFGADSPRARMLAGKTWGGAVTEWVKD